LGSWLLELKLVDEIVEYDKSRPQEWSTIKDELQGRSFNWVVCPHQSLRSLLLVRKLQAQCKLGFGSWWRSLLFHKSLPRPMQLPDALRQLSLMTLVDSDFSTEFWHYSQQDGVENTSDRGTIDFRTKPPIPPWASLSVRQELNQVKSELTVPDRAVALAPGSVWPTKRWQQEGFTELGRVLQRQGYPIVLLGSSGEWELTQRISNSIPGSLNLAGKTSLLESLLVLQRVKALVTNDSGAMHLAAAAGTPSLAVFGPTTLDLGYRPWQSSAIVVQKDIGCRPCGKHGSQKCPIGTHECMKGLPASEVLSSLESIVAEA
jgi:heptosyltransferase-2